MLNILIIDDEAPARKLLSSILSEISDINIIGEASNGFEALIFIQEKKPDLIFLDIQMPKINGFELLEVLEDPPQVIFTTAYSEFAIKAFEANAVDYLLKPISEERLIEAVKKAKKRFEKNEHIDQRKLSEYLEKNGTLLERIVVRTGKKIQILIPEKIVRFEADDDYVKIFSEEGCFIKKHTLKYLENGMNPQVFIRVHRSHLINVNFLEKLELLGKESHVAILKNQEKIPVSSSGYQELKRRLNF